MLKYLEFPLLQLDSRQISYANRENRSIGQGRGRILLEVSPFVNSPSASILAIWEGY